MKKTIVANSIIIAIVVFAAVLEQSSSDLYYLSVQEDEFIEWATVWAFLFAAVLNFIAARRQYARQQGLPWFYAGVGRFCLFVLLEEISWGQRIIGYRPPEYFLDQNFQQEFNLHNVIDTSFRKLALQGVILIYGILLPLLNLASSVSRIFNKVGIKPPPVGLVPVFVITLLLYMSYPWSHTGEWVELLLGLGFLYSSIAAAGVWIERPAGTYAMSSAIVIVLGVLVAMIGRYERESHPGTIAAVEAELAALAADFRSPSVDYGCGAHKRLYTLIRERDQAYFYHGAFAGLVEQGLPEERADFFLDPWNTPYWVRDRCGRRYSDRIVLIYSFGPNRRRDSTRRQILGDDIGVYAFSVE